MPPPTAPVSKPTDPNDLADALTSAGIDLKEEEARLASFSAGGGVGSYAIDPYTGMPVSAEDAHAMEVRRRAQLRTNHLNDPFLNPQVLSNRLLNKTRTENCTAFTLDPAMAAGNQNTDIVTLLSLACRDRLNALLTRSTALAKVRRRPQTQITGEWADHVKGANAEGRPDSASATSPTGPSLKREKSYALSFAESLLNRDRGATGSFSQANTPGQQQTQSSISSAATATGTVVNLNNETAKALRALKQKEWEADQERQRKKARREQSAGAAGGFGAAGGSGAATPGGGDVSAPGTPGAEMVASERKTTAKENRKQQANKIEEAASHRAANATTNMMMGGFGGGFGSKKKKKTYAWMNAGGVAGGGNAMGSQRPGPAGGAGAADAGASQARAGPDLGNLNWTGQRLGVWREDGERGKGIQIRDWVGALEGDGRVGGKGIVKAYLRMK